MELIHNPFQAIDVSVPVVDHEMYTRYCHRGKVGGVDERPFPRMIDMWFFAVCVAVRLELKPQEVTGKTIKMIDGSVFSGDPWRIHALLLIAIAKTNDVAIVSRPTEIMNLANGLAAAGLHRVRSMLSEGSAEAIWNLSDSTSGLLRQNEPASDRNSTSTG